MIQTLKQVYYGIRRDQRNVFLVVLPWLAMAYLGQLLVGIEGDLQSLSAWQVFGICIRILGVMMAWYCAHSYMITPTDNPGFFFAKRQGSFVFWQIVNIAVIVIVAICVLIPVSIGLSFVMPNLSQDEVMRYANWLSYAVAPIILWLFGRLLLAAPLLVRGEPKASRRSWNATRGRGWRLFFLQLVCLIPAILGTILFHLIPIEMIGGAFSVAGMIASIVLYSRLAEDELERLGADESV